MPNIKTFCRIRPTKTEYENHEVANNKLLLTVPEVIKDFGSTAQKGSRSMINHEFNFDHIFLRDATQQDVFDIVALDIVNGWCAFLLLAYFVKQLMGSKHSVTFLEPNTRLITYSILERQTVILYSGLLKGYNGTIFIILYSGFLNGYCLQWDHILYSGFLNGINGTIFCIQVS